jgi:hypothetical protein
VRASRAGITLTRWCRRGLASQRTGKGADLAQQPALLRRIATGHCSAGAVRAGYSATRAGPGLDSADANRRDPEIAAAT